MINKNLTYAVIGVSKNVKKYGHQVFRDLLKSGYSVFPVNPKGGEILGKKVFSSAEKYPKKVDVAILVVQPEVSEAILPGLAKLGIKKVWFQPGSESEKALNICKEKGIECNANACIMLERKEKLPKESREIISVFDENKLLILNLLYNCQEDICGCDLIDKIGISKDLLSYHMKTLREKGFLEETRCGKRKIYTIKKGKEVQVREILKVTKIIR